MDNEFRRQTCVLRTFCQDIVELWRGDHFAERLRPDMERSAEANKEDERALETVIAEVKAWADVRQAFLDAFALLRQRKSGSTCWQNQPREHARIRPDQTESSRKL